MKLLDLLHSRWIESRRVARLAALIADKLPPNASVLDVGCGDGALAHAIETLRPDIRICGVDIHARPNAVLSVTLFDGIRLPFADRSFDIVLLIDVLHHAADPEQLARECTRVQCRGIVMKDHVRKGLLAKPSLLLMDRVGNERYGISSPGRYFDTSEWQQFLTRTNLKAVTWNETPPIYPFPLSAIFGRGLHVFAVLNHDDDAKSDLFRPMA